MLRAPNRGRHVSLVLCLILGGVVVGQDLPTAPAPLLPAAPGMRLNLAAAPTANRRLSGRVNHTASLRGDPPKQSRSQAIYERSTNPDNG